MKTIMKLDLPYNGTWKIIQDEKRKVNMYGVYYIEDGHQKQMERYGDIASCIHHIVQQLTGHEWRMADECVPQTWRNISE